jgi:hypothetical protein
VGRVAVDFGSLVVHLLDVNLLMCVFISFF